MKIWMALASVLLLAGCETIPSPSAALTDDTYSQFKSGQGAILIVNAEQNLNCNSLDIGMNRDGDDANQIGSTVIEAGYQSTSPAILYVPAGEYSYNRVICNRYGYYPSNLPSLYLWFDRVHVTEGEVVYMGTLNAQQKVYQTGGFGDPVLRSFFGDPDEVFPTFVTYTVKENQDVRERVAADHPELAAKMVYRPPAQLISDELITKLRDEAFAPNLEGVLPTPDQARAAFSRLLDAYVKENSVIGHGIE